MRHLQMMLYCSVLCYGIDYWWPIIYLRKLGYFSVSSPSKCYPSSPSWYSLCRCSHQSTAEAPSKITQFYLWHPWQIRWICPLNCQDWLCVAFQEAGINFLMPITDWPVFVFFLIACAVLLVCRSVFPCVATSCIIILCAVCVIPEPDGGFPVKIKVVPTQMYNSTVAWSNCRWDGTWPFNNILAQGCL